MSVADVLTVLGERFGLRVQVIARVLDGYNYVLRARAHELDVVLLERSIARGGAPACVRAAYLSDCQGSARCVTAHELTHPESVGKRFTEQPPAKPMASPESFGDKCREVIRLTRL